MPEIPFILTEWQEINSSLYAPINATKKMQYTCMATSSNYIVLGATSGSIYLFTRDPCVFQQLIPLSEGAVVQVQISPDEKTIALATVRGSVCLVSLKPSFKLITVSNEHTKEKVTCLCWNDSSSEVYVGDESGKVSVLVLFCFMINGVFPSPSYALMNLESKVVQMNYADTTLLISTLNRCYICDTVQEEFKKIGNKPRDGEFGACFLKTHSNVGKVPATEENIQKQISTVKKVFSLSGDFDCRDGHTEGLPQIYCARPSSRLWEVTTAGEVIKTHQFKDALAIAPIPVYKPHIEKTLKSNDQSQLWPAQSINFAQLFVISDKYLFSYTSNGLYILDPENAKVVLWNDEYPDILMAQIAHDKIYLMTSSGVFNCLSLTSVDSLILQLYEKKLYKECLECCHILKPQLVLSAPEEFCDINSEQDIDLPKVLLPVISRINSHDNTHAVKLESGIIVVNSVNKSSNGFTPTTEKELNAKDIQRMHELDDLMITLDLNDTSEAEKHNRILHAKANGSENSEFNEKSKDSKSNEMSSLQTTIFNIQSDLESLSVSMYSQLEPDMTEEQLREVIKFVMESLVCIKEKYEVSRELQTYLFEVIRSAELHYYSTLLENLSIELIHKMENYEVLKQLVKIIVDVNSFKYIKCYCGFPYPVFGSKIDKFIEPKFFDLAKVLLLKFNLNERDDLCLQICNQISCLWRDYLPLRGYAKQKLPNSLLKQCLQIRDNHVLAIILPALDEQQWKIVANCFDNIRNGRCVNCNKYYCNDEISSKEFFIDWHGITHLIIKKKGPKEALTFLSKVNRNLPHISFDKSIYQSIIFSSILHHHGIDRAVELDRSSVEQNSVCSPNVLQEVIKATENDLEELVNKELFGSGPHHWGMRYKKITSTCPCCTLLLQTPVLLGNSGIALFSCGHAYHVNCMIQKKISRCNLHT
ncbi:uncharacterized protein LOC106639526 [Copidosoma floridanum]|uniref:uncharacterized protein LOC106639526 n=1 Tax=Copidosoma floridanum TaxID=29053 RepID=UPI0006C97F02|nr:uncharacterized protein LOC106639526 [Copidosoma floridanum]